MPFVFCWKKEKDFKKENEKELPTTGVEPATSRLQGARNNHYATQAIRKCDIIIVNQHIFNSFHTIFIKLHDSYYYHQANHENIHSIRCSNLKTINLPQYKFIFTSHRLDPFDLRHPLLYFLFFLIFIFFFFYKTNSFWYNLYIKFTRKLIVLHWDTFSMVLKKLTERKKNVDFMINTSHLFNYSSTKLYRLFTGTANMEFELKWIQIQRKSTNN